MEKPVKSVEPPKVEKPVKPVEPPKVEKPAKQVKPPKVEKPTEPVEPPKVEKTTSKVELLPNTGVAEEFTIFSAEVISILTGLSLLIPSKKKQQ